MLLHAVETTCEEGVAGHALVVSRDPYAEPPEPHYSQEELDALVTGGTVRIVAPPRSHRGHTGVCPSAPSRNASHGRRRRGLRVQVPPLTADNQATADRLREAMASGGPMELRLATGGGLETTKDHLLYFDAYDNVDVHRVMLADEARNRAYATAIHKCRHLMQDKAVLDVGCGTGAHTFLYTGFSSAEG
jgi:hypothetical protein